MISEAIHTLLTTHSGLIDLVGYYTINDIQIPKVFPLIAPEGITAPYVIYEPKTRADYQFKNDTDSDKTSVGLMICHKNYITANRIAKQARAALEFKTGTYNDTEITDFAYSETEPDFFEPEELYILEMAFEATHTKD